MQTATPGFAVAWRSLVQPAFSASGLAALH
jgi:hypothetical protein